MSAKIIQFPGKKKRKQPQLIKRIELDVSAIIFIELLESTGMSRHEAVKVYLETEGKRRLKDGY